MRYVNPLLWVTIPCGRREAATGLSGSTSPQKKEHIDTLEVAWLPWEPPVWVDNLRFFHLYGGNPVNLHEKTTLKHYFGTHTVHLWCVSIRQINNNGIKAFQTKKNALTLTPPWTFCLSQELLGAIGQCLSRGANFWKAIEAFLEPPFLQGRSVKTSGV